MGKKDQERRVHTKEFKAEAVALAEKREKPVSQVAKDLGLNENVLCRWTQQTREAELARLRKENKSLREANEILKKAAVIFAQGEAP